MEKLNLFSKLKKLNMVKGRDEKRSLKLTKKTAVVDVDHTALFSGQRRPLHTFGDFPAGQS